MEDEEQMNCENCAFKDSCSRIERVFPGDCQSFKRESLKLYISKCYRCGHKWRSFKEDPKTSPNCKKVIK